MACEYCETSGIIEDATFDGDGVVIEITDGELLAAGFYDGGYCCGTASLAIRFCPMCGERISDAE